MIASSRTARASSGVISGSGLAMAKMIGRGPMLRTISAVSAPRTLRPKNASAPATASAKVRASVATAWPDFHWFIPVVRP